MSPAADRRGAMNLSKWADAYDRNSELEPSLEALLSGSIGADLMRADHVTAKDIKAVVLKSGKSPDMDQQPG